MSIEPFNRMVKLAARAFYDDVTTKGDNQPKTGRRDNKGFAVVVLDALTQKQWVREDDLAKELNLHIKQLRRTLQLFEEEKLVTREHRREKAKGAKMYRAAVAATVDGLPGGKEGQEKTKLQTYSYCCLDYAQIYDVVRYRLHRMEKKLKDELEDKNILQVYVCPNCKMRYNALDALRLVPMEDEYFHCEGCGGKLVAESDKLAAQDIGVGDDNARRWRREKLKDMLQKMEVQLKPLTEILNRVKDLHVPEFGNLQTWEARASAAGLAINGDPGSATPIPFLGEPKVEVAFSGLERKEEVKSEGASTSPKVLPPWMIKQGMNLTQEQCGEVKQEGEGNCSSTQPDFSKKSTVETDDEKVLRDEYAKACYEAWLKKQQELSDIPLDSGLSDSSKRQVGMKAKHDDEEEDDVDWEEG